MSISIVTFPDPGLPTNGSSGYTRQNNILIGLMQGYDGTLLTEWDTKNTEPKLKQSVYFRHAGNIYKVTGADETISGSLSSGKNYVKISGTGDTLTASWITSLSGYTYNPVYNGWYNGTDQALVEFVVLDGSDNINSKYVDRYVLERYVTQDGNFYIDEEFNIQDVNSTFLKWNNVKNSFNLISLPATANISGMTVDTSTGNLIICTRNNLNIWILSGITGTTISNFAPPASNPSGLAFDSSTGNLISCDEVTGLIYIHSGITSTVSSSFTAPGTPTQNPTGLTIDTTTNNLISCDRVSRLIYIHSGITSTVLSSFATPDRDCRGLTYDSTKNELYSCDNNLGLIYRHSGISVSTLSAFDNSSKLEPGGLAYDPINKNIISGTDDGATGGGYIYVHGG